MFSWEDSQSLQFLIVIVRACCLVLLSTVGCLSTLLLLEHIVTVLLQHIVLFEHILLLKHILFEHILLLEHIVLIEHILLEEFVLFKHIVLIEHILLDHIVLFKHNVLIKHMLHLIESEIGEKSGNAWNILHLLGFLWNFKVFIVHKYILSSFPDRNK